MLFDLNHLQNVSMDYWEHLHFSLTQSFLLITGGVIGIIHAICPVVLVTIHTDTVTYCKKLLDDRKNPD